MKLHIVTVVEAPRTGQRKPRRYNFAVFAASEEDAIKKFKACHYGLLYGNGDSDTVSAYEDGGVVRTNF